MKTAKKKLLGPRTSSKFSGFESADEMDMKINSIQDANAEPSLLKEAVFLNNASLVQKLIERGADPNLEMNRGILHAACKHAEAIYFQIKWKQNWFQNQEPIDVLRVLLNHVDDIDQTDDRGNTPLFYLVTKGNGKSAKLLIDSKADIHCPAFIGGTRTSLLWVAVRQKQTHFIKYFLRSGHDPKAQYWGASIFQYLLDHQMCETAEYMLVKQYVDLRDARSCLRKYAKKGSRLLSEEEKELKDSIINYDSYVEEAHLVIFLEVVLTIPIESCDGWISDRVFFTPSVQKWTKALLDQFASDLHE